MFMKLEWYGERNCRELKRRGLFMLEITVSAKACQELAELVYVGKGPAARHGETALK